MFTLAKIVIMNLLLRQLATKMEGELLYDESTKIIYATDASPYREKPVAVAFPKSVHDIKVLIHFARESKISLIPRAAGTSLAGQVVGKGIIVDMSLHMNQVLNFNPHEKWIEVEPGIVRDELNLFLQPNGLFFGPETSTSNRATVGGMVGNNASGANSITVGDTRDHLVEATVVLSDGTEATFKPLTSEELALKKIGTSLEAKIYSQLDELLSLSGNQTSIRLEYPAKEVQRRNTGYAIDAMLDGAPYGTGTRFNICKILAGSEGTLALITSVRLRLLPLPPPSRGVLCVHFKTLKEALQANLIASQFKPYACELIDSYILECTKDNIEQSHNRSFVKGDPQALLIVEFAGYAEEDIVNRFEFFKKTLQKEKLGYYYPVLLNSDIKNVWNLRKAGLGLLSNIPGDTKPVTVIEDTAVAIRDLSKYVEEFDGILHKYNLSTVHYAHAGAGELHMRPLLNLKTSKGQELFKIVAKEIAVLVKKYKGSLSGEHGDGRLRSEFIPEMIGENNYRLLKLIKQSWDPLNIFNPGKIVDAVAMNENLRYEQNRKTEAFKTHFRFNKHNILQHAEQCNGSGDCRKSHLMGGTMCPSFMATKNEKDTTRARANILREFLTYSEKPNKFDHKEIYEVLDLCLSCKGCKSECPSNVDMAKLKAEFLQQYYDANGIPLRARLIAAFPRINRISSFFPTLYNYCVRQKTIALLIKRFVGFSSARTLPVLSSTTLKSWYKSYQKEKSIKGKNREKTVYLFCDEFTNYNDADLGIKAIKLLEALGYNVIIPAHLESGRAAISKGLLRKAKKTVNYNIRSLASLVSSETPLIGIEPSAILSFRDEYPDLVGDQWVEDALNLARHSFTIEEFLSSEIKRGEIKADQFTGSSKKILFHGHCQQKAIGKVASSLSILSLPVNYSVREIRSGCCGMAGSFGFEKEHYDLSMKIGELVLFPTVQKADPDVIIAASGTSCRQQIFEGTGKRAYHPIEILYEAYFQAQT